MDPDLWTTGNGHVYCEDGEEVVSSRSCVIVVCVRVIVVRGVCARGSGAD